MNPAVTAPSSESESILSSKMDNMMNYFAGLMKGIDTKLQDLNTGMAIISSRLDNAESNIVTVDNKLQREVVDRKSADLWYEDRMTEFVLQVAVATGGKKTKDDAAAAVQQISTCFQNLRGFQLPHERCNEMYRSLLAPVSISPIDSQQAYQVNTASNNPPTQLNRHTSATLSSSAKNSKSNQQLNIVRNGNTNNQ